MASGRMGCYHHPSRDAVAQCRKCGKGMCKECYDLYGVSSGEYAGKALCYDCTTEIVAENVAGFEALKKRVQWERIFICIGAVLGAFAGLIFLDDPTLDGTQKFWGFVTCVGVGGSLGTIIKGMFWAFIGARREGEDGGNSLAQAGCAGVFLVIFSPIITVWRFFSRFSQIARCNEIIESDSQALRQMRDYFAYTQAMEQNAGVDLATLVARGGVLFDNAYAKDVVSRGAQTAQAELRRGVAQIAANGEIIRSYNRT